jgi:putative ABC transport system permease protein
MLDSLRRDLRDAFRALRAAPVMSATIVCLVALVVGGNTTVYGLVHAVLTKPARGVVAQQLVTVQRFDPGEPTPTLHQYSDFEVFSESASTLRNIAAVRLEPLTLRARALD